MLAAPAKSVVRGAGEAVLTEAAVEAIHILRDGVVVLVDVLRARAVEQVVLVALADVVAVDDGEHGQVVRGAKSVDLAGLEAELLADDEDTTEEEESETTQWSAPSAL